MASEVENRIKEALSSLDLQGWWVGGSVRDRLLGRALCEEDLLIEGDLEKSASRLAEKLQSSLSRPDPQNRSLRVACGGCPIDVISLNSTLEEDLCRRDFTINAMAMDLKSGRIHDPLNGKKDLAERRLKMTSPRVFCEDPIRLLRALRLSLDLDFNLEELTKEQIHKDASLLWSSAPERITSELCRALAHQDFKKTLQQLQSLHLEKALSESRVDPEDLKKVVLRGDRLNELLSHLPETISSHLEKVLKRELAKERSVFQTLRLDWLGEALKIPQNFYRVLSSAERHFILRRPLREQLAHFVLQRASRWTHSLLKLYREVGEDLCLYLVLASPLDGRDADEVLLRRTINLFYEEWLPCLSNPLLKGTDLIAIGITGRGVGENLALVEIARLEGRITTKDEALSFVKRHGRLS